MRFEGVGLLDGAPYDLVVAVDAGSTYTPGNNSDNGFECGQPSAGCTTGRFVKVSVQAGSSVDLTISFQDSATQAPVTIPSFLFSIHDIDQVAAVKESVYITGFSDSVILDPATEVAMSVESDGRTKLMSTVAGTPGDDPLNPLQLTAAQKKRSAAMVFQSASSVSMTLEVSGTSGDMSSFLFTGDTNLVTCA